MWFANKLFCGKFSLKKVKECMQLYNYYRLLINVRTKTTFYQIYFVYMPSCKKVIQLFNSVSILILASIQIFAVKVSCGWKGWTVNKCLKVNYMDGLERLESEKCKGKMMFKHFKFLYRPETSGEWDVLFTYKGE